VIRGGISKPDDLNQIQAEWKTCITESHNLQGAMEAVLDAAWRRKTAILRFQRPHWDPAAKREGKNGLGAGQAHNLTPEAKT